MKNVLSIDLNRKSAKVGIINQYGEVEDKIIIENDFDDLMNNLALKTKTWLQESGYDYNLDIERIGLSVPGYINHSNGTVKLAEIFNWKEFPLKKIVGEEFKNKRVYILNNASAKALGEFWTGAATSYDSELFYSLGSTVGGAIVINGKLILGEHGFAGAFGHGGLISEEDVCECGLKNCLEPVASTTGLTKKLIKILKENPTHPASEYFALALEEKSLDFKTITKIYQVHSKPPVIKELLKEILKPLITHIAMMISAIDPKSIVIDGDILDLGQDLLEIIQESLEPLVHDFEKKSLVLKPTKLGHDAGLIGAAYFAINNWDE